MEGLTPYTEEVTKLPKEIQELLALCVHSTKHFAKFFFPKKFERPFSRFHEDIFRVIDDDDIQMAAIAAPRGTGKTSILNFAFPAKHILMQSKHFIAPISASEAMAVQQSENLKQELITNPWVQKLFPPIETNEQFSQKRWTAFETMVLPRGRGQQVRGWLYRGWRPDLWLIDDLEDPNEIHSEEYRNKCQRFFFEDLLNSVDRGSKDWRVILICTISHEDCLFERLVDDPSWKTMRVSLCEEDEKTKTLRSLWPEFMSDEALLKLKRDFERQGMLDGFYREYTNQLVPVGVYGFKREWFKYYTKTEDDLNKDPNIETVILIDLARSMKESAAFTAILGVSIDRRVGKLYVRRVRAGHLSVEQIIELTFEMSEEIKAGVIAPEITGDESFIMYNLQQQVLKRKLYHINLCPINPRDKKEKRAGALIPLYKNGSILHRRGEECRGLEAQLLSYPRPRRWDMIDALAHVVPVLYEGGEYLESATEREERFEQDDDLMPLRLDYGPVLQIL